MPLEVTIRNSALVTSINGGNTTVVLGATAPVTVTIGTFLPVPGPAGPTGASGSGARFTHTQATASAVWTVNHNLGYRPTVAVFSAGGVEVEAEVLHVSVNQTRVSFNSAVTGTATFL